MSAPDPLNAPHPLNAQNAAGGAAADTANRETVRVRRSPKVSVFLILGVVVGVIAAIIVSALAPPDPQLSTLQAIGFISLVFGPVGAALGGVVAVILDRISLRRARLVTAERIAERPAPAADAAPESPAGDQLF